MKAPNEVKCVECGKLFAPTINAWLTFKSKPDFAWLCVFCMRAGKRGYVWHEHEPPIRNIKQRIQINLNPSTAKEKGYLDKTEETEQTQ